MYDVFIFASGSLSQIVQAGFEDWRDIMACIKADVCSQQDGRGSHGCSFHLSTQLVLYCNLIFYFPYEFNLQKWYWENWFSFGESQNVLNLFLIQSLSFNHIQQNVVNRKTLSEKSGFKTSKMIVGLCGAENIPVVLLETYQMFV